MASRIVVLAMLGAALGCAGSSEPPRYRVSGSATFDGKPIPFGHIVFTPDGAKQNFGPQGAAIIREGKYDTMLDGKGSAGGPTVITVTGLAGPGGKPLCDHEFKLDLPRGDAVQDLEVPAKAALKARPEI